MVYGAVATVSLRYTRLTTTIEEKKTATLTTKIIKEPS